MKKEAMASWDRMQSLPELAQIEELEAKLQQACKDKRSEQVDKLQKEVRQVFKIHEEVRCVAARFFWLAPRFR